MTVIVGLTGGIGAGKSTVAAVWRGLGATVVDADQLSREVVEPGTPALAEVAAAFGPQVLREDGSLDRARLGRLVFADPARRARLEGIIHPAVQREARARLAAAPGPVAVYDVPLLVEAVRDFPFDAIVVVSAPAEVRQQRLVELRGMDPGEARARIASQATEAERLALADYVIDASGTVADTERQARDLWPTLTAQAAANDDAPAPGERR
ncbi:MAG: dephospho-CoA kinase [Pseudoclavibacter sp.]